VKFYLVCLKNKNESLLLPRLIKQVEQTEFSHVEILAVFHNPVKDLGIPDVALSFGAVFPKSRWCTEATLQKTYEEVERIPLNVKVTDEQALDILFGLLGKPYSPMQLVIIYAKIYLSKALSWLPFAKLNLSSRLICTELAGEFMQEACKYKIDISIETLRLTEAVKIARDLLLTLRQIT
jgi:hypothetical protein